MNLKHLLILSLLFSPELACVGECRAALPLPTIIPGVPKPETTMPSSLILALPAITLPDRPDIASSPSRSRTSGGRTAQPQIVHQAPAEKQEQVLPPSKLSGAKLVNIRTWLDQVMPSNESPLAPLTFRPGSSKPPVHFTGPCKIKRLNGYGLGLCYCACKKNHDCVLTRRASAPVEFVLNNNQLSITVLPNGKIIYSPTVANANATPATLVGRGSHAPNARPHFTLTPVSRHEAARALKAKYNFLLHTDAEAAAEIKANFPKLFL